MIYNESLIIIDIMEKEINEEINEKDLSKKVEELIGVVEHTQLQYENNCINKVELMCLEILGETVNDINNLSSLINEVKDIPFLSMKYSSQILEKEKEIHQQLQDLKTAKENPKDIYTEHIERDIRASVISNLKNRL